MRRPLYSFSPAACRRAFTGAASCAAREEQTSAIATIINPLNAEAHRRGVAEKAKDIIFIPLCGSVLTQFGSRQQNDVRPRLEVPGGIGRQSGNLLVSRDGQQLDFPFRKVPA